jgi:hypothetical protein
MHVLADAAVGMATATEFGITDSDVAALLSSALEAMPEVKPVRVELLTGLARALPTGDPAAFEHARLAPTLARRIDVPRALTIALATSIQVTWGPGDSEQRLAVSRNSSLGQRTWNGSSLWWKRVPGVRRRSNSSTVSMRLLLIAMSCGTGLSRAGGRSSSHSRRCSRSLSSFEMVRSNVPTGAWTMSRAPFTRDQTGASALTSGS